MIVAVALLSVTACGDVTSPSGNGSAGGPVGKVTVGNLFFASARNGSQNPAVDTIAAGGTVTWSWGEEGSHSIQSTGSTTEGIFRNSVVLVGPSYTYSVTFSKPGTYSYDCGVHGSAMTGLIVVQ